MAANLTFVLIQFCLYLLKFTLIKQVQQICSQQLCVILYETQHFFPKFPALAIKNTFRNHAHTRNPHHIIEQIVKKCRDLSQCEQCIRKYYLCVHSLILFHEGRNNKLFNCKVQLVRVKGFNLVNELFVLVYKLQ